MRCSPQMTGVDVPPETEPEFLESGGDDIGTEDPLPQEAPPADDLAARAQLAAGKTVAKLGKWFGLKGLASLGASWIKNALDKVPKLGEGLLGVEHRRAVGDQALPRHAQG